MGQLKEQYYSIMTLEELEHEAEVNGGVPAKIFVDSYKEKISELESELDDAHTSIRHLENTANDLEETAEDTQAELNTLRAGISALVTHTEWTPNEEGGFNLQQNSPRFTFNMEAELFIDTEAGTYGVLVSPYVAGSADVEFEATTLKEAKETALLHVIDHVVTNEIVCFKKAGNQND